MQCLSTSIDKSKDSDLKGDLPKENILSAKLMGLEVIEDKDALQKLLVGQSEDKGLERKMGNLKISNVGQSNEPGTALSGAIISNQSPKAKTQGSH